jgi:LEA14-like dessication related protein
MRKTLLAALVLPVALAGCAGLQDIARTVLQQPKLTFRSASLQTLDLDGATVGFSFDLENPNSFGVDLARVGWGIEVEGTRIATGDLPGGLAVPARGTAPVTFPVRVRFRDVPGIVSLLGGGRDQIAYRLSGAVGVRTPAGVLDVPLSHSDVLKLPSLPRFGVEGLSVRSVSLSTIGLAVRLNVRNPNGFAIPAGKLDYALAIAGAPVARAEGAGFAAVAGGSTRTVEIPVRIDVLSAGRAATDLARGAEVQVDLKGTAEIAGLPLPLDLKARVPARR